MTTELESLTRFALSTSSGARDVELRMPTMKELNGLVHTEVAREPEDLASLLPLVLRSFVARIDGVDVTRREAREVAADAELTRELLVRIRALLDTLRERGCVFALCPSCGLWEAEVGMTAYALTIAEPLPSTFDGPFIATPSLASNLVARERPPLPRAARIRVELPSLHLGIPSPVRMAVLGQVERRPEEFDDVDLDDDPYPDDYDGPIDLPIRDGPVWWALARLGQALEPPLPDDQVESLPAVDFFFLDLVHYLVERAPVRPDTAGRIRCPRCENEFIPVRRDYRA